MLCIYLADLEAAINHWRSMQPSADGIHLAPPLAALAEVYARMCWQGLDRVDVQQVPHQAMQAWLDWYHTTVDTPCIAICSTSQGDNVCKGCGRTFAEIQRWPALSPVEKRATWQRITQEGTAWRFNRYAERAGRVQA